MSVRQNVSDCSNMSVCVSEQSVGEAECHHVSVRQIVSMCQ